MRLSEPRMTRITQIPRRSLGTGYADGADEMMSRGFSSAKSIHQRQSAVLTFLMSEPRPPQNQRISKERNYTDTKKVAWYRLR